MATLNKKILNTGNTQEAIKLPVVTIGLGRVGDLQDLTITRDNQEYQIIWHDADGNVVIRTKEDPMGCIYAQDRIAVVRVIGGKVLIDGLYDIYAPRPDKISKLLGNPIALEAPHVDPERLAELQPVLNIASDLRPSLAPAEYGRKVVLITDDMVGENGFIECVCTWNEESQETTKLFPGDVFLVEDAEQHHGYRIGAVEFAETHELVK